MFEYPVGATPLDPDEAEGLIRGWKCKNLFNPTSIRDQYIQVLRLADRMDYALQLAFVRQ